MAPLARRGAGPPLRLPSAAPILTVRATQGDLSMNLIAAPVRVMLAAAVLAGLALPGARRRAAARPRSPRTARSTISSCRSTRGKRAMNAVRGRILYDFSGSACEGYALQFRQVSELDSGEGKVIVSRSARHLVGGRRGQAPALPFAEFLRREFARLGRRPGRAGRRRRRGGVEGAGREEARSEERAGVSDRARPPHHRRGARRQDAAAGRGL